MLNRIAHIVKKIVPRPIRLRMDAETFSITKFMEFAAKDIVEESRVLDAGAGSRPYKNLFSHTLYESTDFEHVFEKETRELHDFICSLDDIPRPDNSYGAIINTQVLEHVEYPQKVINEFYRILKPGGKLFLTAPQGWGVHGAPYHFYNFTNFGLESLFRHAGFEIKFIKSRGGMFWYLGHRVKTLPSYIYAQHIHNLLIKIVVFPLYVPIYIFCNYVIPFLFFYLDILDKKRDYTLGYACYCIKSDNV